LLLVSVQLGVSSFRLRGWPLAVALVTGVVSLLTNIGVGFLVGLALAYLARALRRRGLLPSLFPKTDDEAW